MSPCPASAQLRSLLAEELPLPQRSSLEAHVEQCPHCQHTLEQLTDDSLLRPSVSTDLVGPTPLLKLRRQPGVDADVRSRDSAGTANFPRPPSPLSVESEKREKDEGAAADEALSLAFLAPVTRPDSLGRLVHYEILEVLGRGGFGIVFRAFDDVLQRVVAIKVLAPELAATSPARKRFLREARAGGQVRHENVVQIYAVEEQPLPYLVMEFIPGETLQQRLDRIGPFDAAEVVAIGRQVAEGLAAAHAAGLIHRDIKPANVLMERGPRQRVKLTDFGLARASDDASLTQSGVVAGTPMYMSPEQACGTALDHRTDLFSLGSVLYAITSGRPPFRAENTMAVLRRVTDDSPRPIREIIPETPAWLCAVIAKLMAKETAQRFQTAGEVSAALEAGPTFAENGAAAARRPTARPRWLLLACGALAVVAALALVSYVLTRPDPRDPGPQGNPAPGAGESAAPVSLSAAQKPQIGPGGFRFARSGWKTRPQVSRDGKLLAAPCGGSVTLFDVTRGEELRTLDGPGDEVRGVGLSPDGRRLAAFSRPGKVRVWNLDDDEVLFTVDADGRINDFEPMFSPDGKHLVLPEDRPRTRLRVLDALTGAEVKSVPTTTWYSGRFDATGRRFAATFANPSGDGTPHQDQDKVTVWDTADWREVGTLKHPPARKADESGTGCLQYSTTGKYLAASGHTGVAIWKADTLEPVRTVTADCWWFDFLPDEHTLLVKGTAEFETAHDFTRYDIASGAKKGEFVVEGTKDFLYVTMDPAREYLFVAPYERGSRLRIFEPLTGRELLPDGP